MTMPPTLSSRFALEREVGRGGVGIVYRAIDRTSGDVVALKVIDLFGMQSTDIARFEREGRLLATLSHPAIVRVIAFGQLDEGEPYVAMEWLDGEDVAQRQRREPLLLRDALEVAAQIADALQAAHDAGIVHRDVKPSNIFLLRGTNEIRAKLVDFGVAAAEDTKLTQTGAIIGTPSYMAPEQAEGEAAVDARADIYSLGATLFELVSGRPPHVGPTPVAVLARLVTTPPPRLRSLVPEAPLALDELIGKLLATQPSERPQSAGEIAGRLRIIARTLDERTMAEPTPAAMLTIPPDSMGSIVLQNHDSSGGSRVVTSILATRVPKGAARARLLGHLRARGADAIELGGDAIVAHLGATRALGDEAARAIDLALRIAKTGASVGIATGRTRIDNARPVGETVDRAAALARDATEAQVICDTTTGELARGRYALQLRADGSTIVGESVKGNQEQVGGSPFVGRDADLLLITDAFERTLDEKLPLLVSITGAAGLGKTRLRREALSKIVSSRAAPQIILVRAESFAKSHALGIMADIARALTQVSKGVSREAAREEAARLFANDGAKSTSPDTIEFIACLLANVPLPHTDSRNARDALWIALTDLAIRRSRERPLVIAIEDAQWADPESVAWVDHLLARAAGHPIFAMLTARPTFWRDSPDAFAGREHIKIELRPLAKRTVRAIAKAILGARAEGPDGEKRMDAIAEIASGSPLFAEELARLAVTGKDAAEAPTIEAAIQVHLDALDDTTRDAARRLSVFGLQGWDHGLEALGVRDVTTTLKALAAAEIITEHAPSRFGGTREWAFKHALMHEVAYASLGEAMAAPLHARAGAWLASVGADDATIAQHLELGGLKNEAAEYLEKAARRALSANALVEAARLAERALAFADSKPVEFSRAQLLDEIWSRLDARAADRESAIGAMAGAIYDEASGIRARGARLRYEDAHGGTPETSTELELVRLDAKRCEMVDEEARSAAALAMRAAYAGDLGHAEEVASDLLILAERHGIQSAAIDAWQALAVVRQTRGEAGQALFARREAARAAEQCGLKTREATLTINVGFALTTLGVKVEARNAIDAGIALAHAVGSAGTVRHGKMNLLCWAATFGSDPSTDALLEEARKIADNASLGDWIASDRTTLGTLFYRGAELLRMDQPGASAEQARKLLSISVDGYRATNMLDIVPVALALLAEAERHCGNPERAHELASEAADLLERGSPSLLNEAPVYLALHDASLDLGALEQAKAAIVRGMPRFKQRLLSLADTPYSADFQTHLVANASFLAAAAAYRIAM